jgi:hypothetical protein
MTPLLVRSTMMLAVMLTASSAPPAFAQSPSSSKVRCSQLMTFFDWYGASRSENSDGARNHARIAAGLDCQSGRTAEGVATMEDLLRRKKFDVPAQPTGFAASPMERVPETAAATLMR